MINAGANHTDPALATRREPAVLHARPRPLQYLAGLAGLALVALIIWTFANAQIDWSIARRYLFNDLILEGLQKTVVITVLSFIAGLVLGIAFALMRISSNKVLSCISFLYVWIFRGTPLLVQLLLWFNLALIVPTLRLPFLDGMQTIDIMQPVICALVGLALNEGAYLTEVIRGGILSVDHGQVEASSALGLPPRWTMRSVVLPQAMPAVLPNLGNSAIGLLKTSSLCSLVSYPEIVSQAQSLYFVNSRVMEILLVVAFWYLACTSVMSVGQYYMERRFARSHIADRRSLIETVPRRLLTRADGLRGAGGAP